MRLFVTHAVPAFDMAQGRDAEGNFSLIHWPLTLGYCPVAGDLLALEARDSLIVYDSRKASVLAFQGFDVQTLASMRATRLFLTERVGEAFVHHPVGWVSDPESIEIDHSALE